MGGDNDNRPPAPWRNVDSFRELRKIMAKNTLSGRLLSTGTTTTGPIYSAPHDAVKVVDSLGIRLQT
jgi:hypothetical protein